MVRTIGALCSGLLSQILLVAFRDALANGNYEFALSVVERAPVFFIKECNRSGLTMFHLLCHADCSETIKSCEDLRIAETLIRRGCDVHQLDINGRSSLYYACIQNNLRLVLFLLNQGVNVNQIDRLGRTPIFYSIATHGDAALDVVRELLAHKARLNLVDTEARRSPLMHAVLHNAFGCVRLFFGEFPNLEANTIDAHGQNVIHHAVMPSHFATFENVDLLRYLARKSIDLNICDSAGLTPMMLACQQRSGVMVNALAALGVQPFDRKRTSVSPRVELPDPVNFLADGASYRQSWERKNLPTSGCKPVVGCVDIDPCSGFDCDDDCLLVRDEQEQLYDVLLVSSPDSGTSSKYSPVIEFFKMQLYAKSPTMYFVWQRFGTNVDGHRVAICFHKTPEAAREVFLETFHSRTGLSWNVRYQEGAVPGKMKLVEPLWQTYSGQPLLPPLRPSQSTANPPRTALERPLVELMSFATNLGRFDAYLLERNLGFGLLDLSTKDIREAESLLTCILHLFYELSQLPACPFPVNNNTPGDVSKNLARQIQSLSVKYFTLLPPRSAAAAQFRSFADLVKQCETLSHLRYMQHTANAILGSFHCASIIHPMEYCYRSTSTKLQSLAKFSEEFRVISEYTLMASELHPSELWSVANIFSISKERVDAVEDNVDQPRTTKSLLWHCIPFSCLLGAIALGLQPPASQIAEQGRECSRDAPGSFAKELHFTDLIDASVCRGSSVDEHLCALLCEVDLGLVHEMHSELSVQAARPSNGDSLLIRGTHGPDFGKMLVGVIDGARIPYGRLRTYSTAQRDAGLVRSDTPNRPVVFNDYVLFRAGCVVPRHVVVLRTTRKESP